MSSEVSIDVAGVGKAFPIYEKPYHRLLQMLSPSSHKKRWFREFRALNDVSFQIRKGETVGIVGRNGSGKSTLLQIICGTLAASSGGVKTHGRIAALLELGAGFNLEFTGRENVYLNGTLLGLTREEVQFRFDAISAFADIGDFIDQPVKSYSSGMFIRLAFAVAIHVEPDILIVDEALSVGDEAFQRKCFSRIERLRDDGATIIFVSHSASTVLELCDRAILLDRGDLLATGQPKQVIALYQRMIFAKSDDAAKLRLKCLARTRKELSEDFSENAENSISSEVVCAGEVDGDHYDPGLISQSTVRYDSRGARIDDPHVQTVDGRRVNVLRRGGEYVYVYTVSFDSAAVGVRFGMLIKTITGVELGGAVSSHADESIFLVEAGEKMEIRFKFLAMLNHGTYFMNAGVIARVGEERVFMDRLMDAVAFRIAPGDICLSTGFIDFHVVPEVRSVPHASQRV